jgi:hypothetical protein
MKVTITCKSNPRKLNNVYATLMCGEELIISATLEYVLATCSERGYFVENANELLHWLKDNIVFVPNNKGVFCRSCDVHSSGEIM